MTNWTTLTLTDLEDYLLAPQIAALRTAALADGQDDPVARTIADVVIGDGEGAAYEGALDEDGWSR